MAKELFPYLYVFTGPNVDSTIILLATHAFPSGMSKWSFGKARREEAIKENEYVRAWAKKAIAEFRDYVDPRTLKFLETASWHIELQFSQGNTGIWIGIDGIRPSPLKPA